MSETQQTQETLIGEPSGDQVTIETSGRVIRPLFELPRALVDECKLTFRDDGLHVCAVDPANVGMVQLHAHADAFERYEFDAEDELTVGINLKRFRKHISTARKGKTTDDPVTLGIDETMTAVEVEREYERVDLTRESELLNIDSDRIREEPDVPELGLPWEATVDLQAFVDAVEYIDHTSDHIEFREFDGDLVLGGTGDSDITGEYGAAATFDSVAERVGVDDETEDPAEGAASTFSLDYISDYASAMKKGLVDDVQMAWGNNFPVYLEFKRTIDDEIAYEGQFMSAPRISED